MDLGNNLGAYIALSYRHMALGIGRKLAPLNIGAGQYPYLLALFMEDGQSQQTLADRLGVDKSAAARAIARLEQSGYIRRESDANDRRSRMVFVTEKGRAARPIIEEALSSALEILQDGMSKADRKEVERLMKIAVTNVTKAPGVAYR